MIQVIRETHRTPRCVDEALCLAGSCNRFGEPNYRAVWGWSRLDWIGGKWEDRNADGTLLREVVELRLEPKYLPHNRWYIERWLPPESYGSPEQWHAETLETQDGRSIPALGPYPSRGEYEHCFTVEGPRGEFVQLTPTVARHIARAIEVSRGMPRARRREALEARARREERAYDSYADAVFSGDW
jgi:hypothetical protein